MLYAQAAIPPVLLDTPVSGETCGDAAAYVPRERPQEVGRAVEQSLFDEQARSAILAAAPGVLARRDWARAAREALRVIEPC